MYIKKDCNTLKKTFHNYSYVIQDGIFQNFISLNEKYRFEEDGIVVEIFLKKYDTSDVDVSAVSVAIAIFQSKERK